MNLSDEALSTLLSEKQGPCFENFPCHTQTVERLVKVITDASSKVCGDIARDGYIRTKLEARKNLPYFDNKSHIIVLEM